MSSTQYALLGLDPRHNPTEREITKAYRMLSLRYHPDKAPEDSRANRKFCTLNYAYEAVKSHCEASAARLEIADARRVAAEAKAREEYRRASQVDEDRHKRREAGRLEAERIKRENRENREDWERERLERERIVAEQREKQRLAKNRWNFQETTSKFTEQVKAENRVKRYRGNGVVLVVYESKRRDIVVEVKIETC